MELSFKKASAEILPSGFTNHREYLKALYDHIRNQRKRYSYVRFSEELGLGSCQASRVIILGQRRITEKTAIKMAKAIGLRNTERRYFLEMVKANRSKDKQEQEDNVAALVNFKRDLATTPEVAKQLFLFSEWYHGAILELVRLKESVHTIEWIREHLQFQVAPKKVEESLNMLQEAGYLVWNVKTYRFEVKQVAIESLKEVQQVAAVGYHTEMIQLAKDSIVQVDQNNRFIISATVATTPEMKKSIFRDIEALCDKIIAASDGDPRKKTEITQVNFQAFPLAASQAPSLHWKRKTKDEGKS